MTFVEPERGGEGFSGLVCEADVGYDGFDGVGGGFDGVDGGFGGFDGFDDFDGDESSFGGLEKKGAKTEGGERESKQSGRRESKQRGRR